MFRIIVAFLTVIPMATAAAQHVESGKLTHGTLAFDAHASLGAFTGTTSDLTGELTGGGELADARGWVEAKASTLTTHNGHRDRDMAKSLEVDKYPVLRFDLDSVAKGTTRGDSTEVTLHGRFTIHGERRAAAIPGWVVMHDHDVRFHGSTPLECRDYKVSGLSKMLGTLRMNEKIVVRIDVTFVGGVSR